MSNRGFREEVLLGKKIREVQYKEDSVLVYMIKKIVKEEFIFLVGNEDIIDAIAHFYNMQIGLVIVGGKDVPVGDKDGSIEKLYMMKKSDDLKEFMKGRDISKLVGLVIKYKEGKKDKGKENGIDIIVASIGNDEEFNLESVCKKILKIFPRISSERRVNSLQKGLISAAILDTMIDLVGKKDLGKKGLKRK